MSDIPVQRNASWLDRPLCRRYVFAKFKTLQLPIKDGDAVEHLAWRWALGMFKQGEYEVLGAWPEQAVLALVTQDLRKRGIEHIKAIAGEDGGDFAPPYVDAAPLLPAQGSLDTHSLNVAGGFIPRRRTALQLATATAERLHKSITRAIRRRAPFANEVAAATFLAEALERADRQLYAT